MMRAEHQKIKSMLTDTVTLLCKNGLNFKQKLKIQGLIALTVDDSDILLVDLNDILFSEHESSNSPTTAGDDLLLVEPHVGKTSICRCDDSLSSDDATNEQPELFPVVKVEENSDCEASMENEENQRHTDYTSPSVSSATSVTTPSHKVSPRNQFLPDNELHCKRPGATENLKRMSPKDTAPSLNECFPNIVPSKKQRHEEPHKESSGKHMCPLCNKQFSQKANLVEHNLRVHMNIMSKCKYCGKSYRSLSVFIKHVKKLHNHQGSYRNAIDT